MSGLAVRAAAAVRAPEAREPDDRAAALGYFHDLLAPPSGRSPTRSCSTAAGTSGTGTSRTCSSPTRASAPAGPTS